MSPTIRGSLEFLPLGDVEVRVALEDITMQDEAAKTIAEVRLERAETGAEFQLSVPDDLDPARDYNLIARAARSASGRPIAATYELYSWHPGSDRRQRLRLNAFPKSKESEDER